MNKLEDGSLNFKNIDADGLNNSDEAFQEADPDESMAIREEAHKELE